METQPSQNDEETLEDLFIRFARTLLTLLKEWTTTEEIPQRFHKYVEFLEVGLHLQHEIKKDYLLLVLYHRSHPFWTSEETVHYVRKHWNEWKQFVSPEWNFPDELTSDHIMRLTLYELVFPVFEVLEQTKTFQPTQEQLLRSYARFQKRWTTTDAFWEVTIPLLQFTCDFQQTVQIGSHLQLAPFTLEEKTDVWNQTNSTDLMQVSMPTPVDINTFHYAAFKLTGFHIAQKNGIKHSEEIATEVLDILAALRLVKTGDVGIHALFQTNDLPRTTGSNSSMYIRNDQILRGHGSKYTLTKDDLPTVRVLLDALLKLRTQQQSKKGKQLSQRGTEQYYGDLTLALGRFNQSYSRNRGEDRVIDLTIALESSLFPKQETELRYRFALRGATLLAMAGAKDWEPHKSKAFLQVMYDVRSSIVHNGQQLADLEDKLNVLQKVGMETSTYEFLRQCENIVREILRACVQWRASGRSKDAIIADVERWIVDGIAAQSQVCDVGISDMQ